MNLRLLPLLSATFLLSLSGCGAQTDRLAVGLNPSLYSVHQPIVQRTEYALDLQTSGGLILGETERLGAWLGALQVEFGDRITLSPTDQMSHVAVRDVAARYGLVVEQSDALLGAAVPAGTTRVVIRRATANVPGCPDWSSARGSGAPITTDPNYGCASNSNLAAMVADANDLVRGRSGGALTDPVDAALAVTNYRDRTQTGVPTLSSGLDAVSNVGGASGDNGE